MPESLNEVPARRKAGIGRPPAQFRGGYPPPLTREELATFLNVSTRTIERYVRAGRIPVVRVAGLVRFRLQDAERAPRENSFEEAGI